jgi:hypothetical protein
MVVIVSSAVAAAVVCHRCMELEVIERWKDCEARKELSGTGLSFTVIREMEGWFAIMLKIPNILELIIAGGLSIQI